MKRSAEPCGLIVDMIAGVGLALGLKVSGAETVRKGAIGGGCNARGAGFGQPDDFGLGEPGPLLSEGLVGREESSAVSLKTRSLMDAGRCIGDAGEPGEEGARVVAFDHRLELGGTLTAV